jgi:MinD superfamily P-loop ATPase
MTYIITEKCIMCGSCEPFCKMGAIYDGDDRYVIDQSKCDNCGICVEYCPIDDAIVKAETAVDFSSER